jgi:ppGpp synthetase/RelA/SpoT-type nucleotidyltranferase
MFATVPNQLPHVQLLSVLHDRVRATIDVWASSRGYAFLSRVKSLESTIQKAESGRYSTYLEIDDLVAVTVIVPSLAQTDEVLAFLRATFFVAELRSRASDRLDPDTFKFDVPRAYCRLVRPAGVETADVSIYSFLFEVQIRTAFQHAWCVATHDLAYRHSDTGWARQRLAWLLKAEVENLDNFIVSFDGLLGTLPRPASSRLDGVVTVSAWIDGLVERRIVEREKLQRDQIHLSLNILSAFSQAARQQLNRTLPVIEAELLTMGAPELPRSITLCQAILVAAKRKNCLSGQADRPWFVTEELVQLFPELHDLGRTFALQEPSAA